MQIERTRLKTANLFQSLLKSKQELFPEEGSVRPRGESTEEMKEADAEAAEAPWQSGPNVSNEISETLINQVTNPEEALSEAGLRAQTNLGSYSVPSVIWMFSEKTEVEKNCLYTPALSPIEYSTALQPISIKQKTMTLHSIKSLRMNLNSSPNNEVQFNWEPFDKNFDFTASLSTVTDNVRMTCFCCSTKKTQIHIFCSDFHVD